MTILESGSAVRCLTQLVGPEQEMSPSDIARLEDLDPDAVERTLARLALAGLVRATPGGYRLARSESTIRVGDVRGALALPHERVGVQPGNAVTLAEILRWEDLAFETSPVA